MKKHYFFFGLAWLTVTGLFAQITLINSMLRGGSADDNFFEITHLPGDEILITGYTQSSDGDLSSNEGSYDIWLMHLDASYNVILNTSLGGDNFDFGIKTLFEPGVGYFIVGYTYSSSGGIVTHNYGVSDIWVIHLDLNGQLVWQETYGGSNYDEAMDAILDASGDLVIAGTSYSSDHDLTGNWGGADAWVLKINKNTGTIIWQKNFGGSGEDYLWAIYENAASSEYIVTGFSNSSDHDLSGYTQQGNYDLWVAGISYTGAVNWVKAFGGSAFEMGTGITSDSAGDIYVVGTTGSTNGDISNPLGGDDAWLLKLDGTSKNLVLEKTFGGSSGDSFSGITWATTGQLVISGSTSSNDHDVSNNIGSYDIWALSVDTSGNLLEEKTFGGTDYDASQDIVELSNGHFVISGSSQSNDGDFNGLNHGTIDGALITFIFSTSNINSLTQDQWQIYPVPAQENLHIKTDKAFQTIEIYDLQGKNILSKHMKPTKSYNLNINDLNQGNYIIKIKGADFEASKKFTVQ